MKTGKAKSSNNDPEKNDGRISLCPSQGCQFKCCTFQQGNYIVLYPGEREEALQENPASLKHLSLTPYKNGYKAICQASETKTCDQGYKPLDCKSYPFFPGINQQEVVDVILKGKKCPLKNVVLKKHAVWVRDTWKRLCKKNARIYEWLKCIDLVGYDAVSEIDIDEEL